VNGDGDGGGVTFAEFGTENPRLLEQKIDSIPAETALRINALQKARIALSEKQLALAGLCCEILDVCARLPLIKSNH